MSSNKTKFKNTVKHFFGFAGIGLVAIILCGFLHSSPANAKFNAATDCPDGTLFKSQPNQAKAAKDIHTAAECNMRRDSEDLMVVINQILNVIIGVIGIVTVAVIVIGGLLYTTSQGDTGKITKAKNTILYGVVGLIVAILAFATVNFILTSVFGSQTSTTKDDMLVE